MTTKLSLGFILLGAVSCGGTDIKDFTYGAAQPGTGLAEGGEIRHENVRILGMPVQTWVHVYQYTAPTTAATSAPFPAVTDPDGIYGNCVDERNGKPTWPFTPITGARYLELPKVELSGPGITGVLNIERTNPPNKAGNSTFRAYDFTYGGGAPGDPAGFNASKTTAAMSTAGGEYTLDIGKGEPMKFFMPEAYVAPLGIGGAATVMIPRSQDLEYSWETPANDMGADGKTHTKKTYFNFTLFADPMAPNQPQFICFPDRDGHQFIPKAVIEALPEEGLIVNANLSHYLEARPTENGETRRFDLVTIYCNISAYKKQ